MTKPKLMIISTYDTLCGVASYTRALVPQLTDVFEVTVEHLDQALMKGIDLKARQAADEQIKAICSRASYFDFINLQYEPSSLGRNANDIMRRFTLIVDAAPALVITLHTLVKPKVYSKLAFLSLIRKLKIESARDYIYDARINLILSYQTFEILRRAERKKIISLLVHTKRDNQYLRNIFDFKHVFDHPLVYFSEAQRQEIAERRPVFPQLEKLPSDIIRIGLFGFFKPTKGFDTAIQALRILPENYHLLFFGGVHPEDMETVGGMHPYLARLINVAAPDPLNQCQQLWSRMHFLGSLKEEDFAPAMNLCDMLVLPYVENGQSASGVASIALEMGKRILATRCSTFIELSEYFPETVELFDVGNFVDLSDRISSPRAFPASALPYDVESNLATYIAATIDRKTHPVD